MKHIHILIAVLFAASAAQAELIDFENADSFTGDDGRIRRSYLDTYGVRIRAWVGKDADDNERETIRFEATGDDDGDDDDNAFEVGEDKVIDHALEGSLGDFFLKVGDGDIASNHEEYLRLSIDFFTPTTATSATIWDIDDEEQFGVVAFDAAGNEVASLESPIGGLDGLPWTWSMTVGGGITISKIEITKIGDEHLHGFGFDDFNTTAANAGAMTHNVPLPAAFPLGCLGLAAVIARARRRTRRRGNSDK